MHYVNLEDKANITKTYKEEGYVIVPNLISKEKIDYFLEGYEKLKKKKFYIIRAQDTNRPEKLEVNKQGFIEHSIWNPHYHVLANKFSDGVYKIITDKGISDVLEAISGEPKHTIWQSMFFDKSTGTVAHQDHYYLDTDPPGGVVGIWVALEDIDEECGPFYVYPTTHLGVIANREAEHNEDYVGAISNALAYKDYKKVDCTVKKGDVIFWHSCTIHGSNENKNPMRSRKSITGHYFPNSFNKLGTMAHGYIQVDPTMPTINPAIDQWKKSSLEKHVRHLRYGVRYFLNSLSKKQVKVEMKTIDGEYQGKRYEKKK
ncbi:MAG: phytanoyl-CoA dioxygenase family protein [Chitinophagales bacterium]